MQAPAAFLDGRTFFALFEALAGVGAVAWMAVLAVGYVTPATAHRVLRLQPVERWLPAAVLGLGAAGLAFALNWAWVTDNPFPPLGGPPDSVPGLSLLVVLGAPLFTLPPLLVVGRPKAHVCFFLASVACLAWSTTALTVAVSTLPMALATWMLWRSA